MQRGESESESVAVRMHVPEWLQIDLSRLESAQGMLLEEFRNTGDSKARFYVEVGEYSFHKFVRQDVEVAVVRIRHMSKVSASTCCCYRKLLQSLGCIPRGRVAFRQRNRLRTTNKLHRIELRVILAESRVEFYPNCPAKQRCKTVIAVPTKRVDVYLPGQKVDWL